MEGMERISRAILDKAREDAEQITKEAEDKAWQEIEKAEKQREMKFHEAKRRTIEEAKRRASQILAQAHIQARQELSGVKADIVNEIVDRVRTTLPTISGDKGSLLSLLEEAAGQLGSDKVRVYVSHRDLDTLQELATGNKELASRIAEIKELDCAGGAVAESTDGKLSIDNTYETRLEMLLPQIVPEISRELFGH